MFVVRFNSALCRKQASFSGISDSWVLGLLEPVMGSLPRHRLLRQEGVTGAKSNFVHQFDFSPSSCRMRKSPYSPSHTVSFKWETTAAPHSLCSSLFYSHTQRLVIQLSSGRFWASCPSGQALNGVWGDRRWIVSTVIWAASSPRACCLNIVSVVTQNPVLSSFFPPWSATHGI